MCRDECQNAVARVRVAAVLTFSFITANSRDTEKIQRKREEKERERRKKERDAYISAESCVGQFKREEKKGEKERTRENIWKFCCARILSIFNNIFTSFFRCLLLDSLLILPSDVYLLDLYSYILVSLKLNCR